MRWDLLKLFLNLQKFYASKNFFTALAKNPLIGLYEIISITFTVFIKLAIEKCNVVKVSEFFKTVRYSVMNTYMFMVSVTFFKIPHFLFWITQTLTIFVSGIQNRKKINKKSRVADSATNSLALFQFPTPLVKLQNKLVYKLLTRQFAC